MIFSVITLLLSVVDMRGKCTVKMITGLISHRICFTDPQLSAEHCNEYEDHCLQSNIMQNKITNNNNNNNLLTLMLFQTFMTSEKHRMCVPEERNSSQLQFRNILFNFEGPNY